MFGNANSARLRRIMHIRSFIQARDRYDSIKPIRGRPDETIRPLSDRGAVDTYSIRKHESQGQVRYECWMYRTPVVTYFENGNITFELGNWPSASTRTFIAEVTGFSCGVKDGTSYISLPMGKVVMPSNGPTTVRRSYDGARWELVCSIKVTEVQLQRKEANNVRARYKEFSAYVNNMIKLRAETLTYANMQVLRVDITEFDEHLHVLPGWQLPWRELRAKKSVGAGYAEVNKVFFALINPDQPEHCKIHNFYTAFLYLIAAVHNIGSFSNFTSKFSIPVETVTNALKEVMYKYHSDEVFKVVELPVGKVPNKKYEKWA